MALVYRIFGHDVHARVRNPGHPDYLYRAARGTGRLDNAAHYDMCYYGHVLLRVLASRSGR